MRNLRQQWRIMIFMILLFCCFIHVISPTTYAADSGTSSWTDAANNPPKKIITGKDDESTDNTKKDNTKKDTTSKDSTSSGNTKKETPKTDAKATNENKSEGSSSWGNTTKPVPSTSTDVKSNYPRYSDKLYFSQMTKVYVPDTSMLAGTSWVWTIVGLFIALVSLVGFLIWIFVVLIHIFQSLRAKVRLGDTAFWNRAIMFLAVMFVSMSGGLIVVLIQWFSIIQNAGGS